METERNGSSGSVDDQIVLEKPLIEPTFQKTEERKVSFKLADDNISLEESLVVLISKKTERKVGETSSHDPTENEGITKSDGVSLASALEYLSLDPPGQPLPKPVNRATRITNTSSIALDRPKRITKLVYWIKTM